MCQKIRFCAQATVMAQDRSTAAPSRPSLGSSMIKHKSRYGMLQADVPSVACFAGNQHSLKHLGGTPNRSDMFAGDR